MQAHLECQTTPQIPSLQMVPSIHLATRLHLSTVLAVHSVQADQEEIHHPLVAVVEEVVAAGLAGLAGHFRGAPAGQAGLAPHQAVEGGSRHRRGRQDKEYR